jgi:WD40 repeat protein
MIRTLEGHMNWLNAVAVMPDGHRAVSALGDRTLRVWDSENGQTLRTLEGHRGFISDVAVTTDGLPCRVGLE